MNLPVTSFQPSTVTELRMSTGSVVSRAGAPAGPGTIVGLQLADLELVLEEAVATLVGEAGFSGRRLVERLA